MSAEDGGGAGRREVAYRVFAAEYDDASMEHSDSEEERAPNYVVTPTGARVNRLFVVGVLTEVEPVSDDVLRGRVVDPTGAFVLYAGQYQPDARTFLESADPPMFVAVTGKARTYRPEDSERVLTSIRPESINEVDAATRDRWTVQAARHTADRVGTMADALDRPERGEDLREALLDAGIDEGLAAGIPLAIEHYGTTTAYLDALLRLAVQAAEVVADEREEVEALDLAPDEGGDIEVSVESDLVTTPGAEHPTVTADTGSDAGGEAAADPDAEPASEAESEAPAEAGAEEEPPADTDAGEPATATTGGGTGDSLEDFDEFDADEPAEEVGGDDELYEFDQEEREAVEEEFGTEFETGTEVDEPGTADIDTPDPEAATDEAADATEAAPAGDAEVGTDSDGGTDADPGTATPTADEGEADPETEPSETADAGPSPEPESGTTEGTEEIGTDDEEAGTEAVDVEDAVMDAMRDLDEGDGAQREAVVERVTEDHGVDAGAVEDAIQDALMSGRCYEPDDGLLKAI